MDGSFGKFAASANDRHARSWAFVRRLIILLTASLALVVTRPAAAEAVQHPHLSWTRNASIYEVNIRQYTPQGTIKAFEKHLPRLKKMGVKILWIMPVQPIGQTNRKGSLGSYYSIRDYTGINPEFGTQADFNQMVKSAHALGMKVILDWVANHTAWDHPWITAHPDWYKKDAQGKLVSYNFDNGREIEYWTDVVGLDYRQPELWDAMIAAMKFWVTEAGIDGFRCDVASLVPTPFWIRARAELDGVKPMFMLAESNDPAIHVAFDTTYDWKLFDTFADIAQGKADARALVKWVQNGQDGFPRDAYRMNFTSNHDVNSWRWSDKDLYGEKFHALAVLAATLPGMPMILGGQESGLDKKIAFFEKDAIDWKRFENVRFYRKLLQLKARHPALANGEAGGAIEMMTSNDDHIFAFKRKKGDDHVQVTVNLSPRATYVERLGKVIQPWGFDIRDNGKR
jgi:glycosidase